MFGITRGVERTGPMASQDGDHQRWAAALLAVVMVGGACSGSGGGLTGGGVERAEETDPTDLEGGLFDDAAAEESGGEVGDDAEAGDDLLTADELESGGPAADSSSTPAPDRDGRGFFAQDRFEGDSLVADYGYRRFIPTARDPLSTFALDVDTASYSLAARWLSSGSMPPIESVRPEEYLNAFGYDYPAPGDGLAAVADAGPSPFDPGNVIVRIGVQAEEVTDRERPAANLTFVVDTSGSMDRPDRLGLVKESLIALVNELDRRDSVALVTYADDARVLLAPTMLAERDAIIDAIDSLRPTGSTNLEAGLATGYDLAREAFLEGGVNRVVLASDGVANVGLTDPDGLVRMIRDDADAGIQLVTVGVGMGDFDDVVMETLADDGDGFYAYVDDIGEANRLFSEDLVGTLLTVAIDSKIQVDFDADAVAEYRLIGFENRAVLDDDFRDDAVDAGELGAGHQVTALYELRLERGVGNRDRLGTVLLRWEDPDSGQVIENRMELSRIGIDDRWSQTSEDFRLAVTVAAWAEILRDNPFAEGVAVAQVLAEAEALARDTDRAEVWELVDLVERSLAMR